VVLGKGPESPSKEGQLKLTSQKIIPNQELKS